MDAPSKRKRRRNPSVIALAVLSILALTLQGGVANAKGGGGTAKPPPGAIAPTTEPTLLPPAAGAQPFTTDPLNIHGFTDVGFVQDATVDTTNAACPNTTKPANFGGSVTINNVKIQVPCNLTIQMPANTFTWSDFVNFPGAPPFTLKQTAFPSFEVQVVGNTVAGNHIAALMYFSQQSVNAQFGYIKSINYADGSFTVDTGAANPLALVQINDPKLVAPDVAAGTGRYSAGQSPDARLSADQNNPTITAATGYPMCIPRTDPATGDDSLCPKRNRPLTPNAPAQPGLTGNVAQGCRNFSEAGIPLPKSGELKPPGTPGQVFCSQFVMKDPNAPATAPSFQLRAATDPDARQQVPFEVGDHVIYSGSLFKKADGTQYTSAHTIEAQIGVYTQPGNAGATSVPPVKSPHYIQIGATAIGTADPLLVAVTGVDQEAQDRLVLEASTTDITSPVDIFLPDISQNTGKVRSRWVTPFEMTSENQAGVPSGGITTQFTGPQPQRARIRATKAPPGLLSNPPRTIRVSNRDTCVPSSAVGSNPQKPTDPDPGQTAVDTCLNTVPLVANGLQGGEYTAPMFGFIFPENIRPGDVFVPNDFWHLGFLRYGEGANPLTPTVGPLEPQPW